ncbi:MAG TPA: DUF6206 family protein [Solirubrobacterales bacterium]|nr:DUF6206 family protein [Solirubrobacterales bacterium]
MSDEASGLSAADLSDAELRLLDDLVERALSGGREEALPVLGYGEISLVLGWPPDGFRFACKRLPPFGSRTQFDAYRRTLRDYVRALGSAGVRVVDTDLRPVERSDGRIAGYVVQPILPADRLAPTILRGADPERGHPLVEAVVSTIAATVSPSLGLDAQLANWTWDGGGLTYFDVSTPLIWSPEGRSRLDLDLIAEAYPAILRWHLRRFVAPRILDTYRDLRRVYRDFSGNLLKERLDPWLPSFLERANAHLTEPLGEDEVRRYYRSDARLWGALMRIRRLDRTWRRRVRRRPYPFLLPGRIER